MKASEVDTQTLRIVAIALEEGERGATFLRSVARQIEAQRAAARAARAADEASRQIDRLADVEAP
jgi:hypothetical protein